MSSTTRTQLHGSVLVHTGAENLGAALAQVRQRTHSGLVYTGPPDRASDAAFRLMPGRVILDAGRWRKTFASADDLFGFANPEGQESLLPAHTLADVAASASAAVARVLSPTGFIPADRTDLMVQVLREAAQCRDSRLVPLIPTGAAVLDGDRLPQVVRILNSASTPAALILADKRQPMAAAGRVAGLRALLDAAPGTMVLGCEPAVAFDAVLHGASMSSIGVTGTLRKPGPPGSGGFANGRVPGMFVRELWEFRSPVTYAEWFEGRRSSELVCQACSERRRFSSFNSGPQDRSVILTHNLHAWLGLLDELVSLDEAKARLHLAGDRREGLERHAELRPHVPLSEFDPVIRQCVELDDGCLPVLLSRRGR